MAISHDVLQAEIDRLKFELKRTNREWNDIVGRITENNVQLKVENERLTKDYESARNAAIAYIRETEKLSSMLDNVLQQLELIKAKL